MSVNVDNLFPLDAAVRLARPYLKERGRSITQDDILTALEIAAVLIGATFEDWDSATDQEKEDQSVALGGLLLARTFLHTAFKGDE